jgi:hypothetical protein
MTVTSFQQLTRDEQLQLAFQAGTFLARRWQSAGSVNLYHLPVPGGELFIEVACADAPGCPVQWVRVHTTAHPLFSYADDVVLPAL